MRGGWKKPRQYMRIPVRSGSHGPGRQIRRKKTTKNCRTEKFRDKFDYIKFSTGRRDQDSLSKSDLIPSHDGNDFRFEG